MEAPGAPLSVRTKRKTWTPELLKEHYDALMALLHEELEGFPEHYALRSETMRAIDLLRDDLQTIRADHVRRDELEEVKQTQTSASEALRVRLDEANGRRGASIIAASVVTTIIAVMFAVAWNSQVTRAEVSDQIAREAPWNHDKTVVEARIAALETTNARQDLQIAQMQTQIRYFCATRVQARLPGC